MTHLSREELLLLAEGELAPSRAAHAAECEDCQSAQRRLLEGLQAAETALRDLVPPEPVEAQLLSRSRFQAALREAALPAADHLDDTELLLHLDDELAPERALHLESCPDCHRALLTIQALLFRVEHELRALIPAERAERRQAAVESFRRRLRRQSKVLGFPLEWPAIYAAAAVLALAAATGSLYRWLERPTVELVLPETAEAPLDSAPSAPPETPAPEVVDPPQFAAAPPPSAAEPETVPQQAEPPLAAPLATLEAAAPERYALAERAAREAPEPEPLGADQGPALAFAAATVPNLNMQPVVSRPPRPEPETVLAALEGRWLLDRAGVVGEDLEAVPGERGWVVQGKLQSNAEVRRVRSALQRAAGGRRLELDIETSAAATALAGRPVELGSGDAPGGPVRRALLDHYADAARRSFQNPEATALDAEAARYVGQIVRSQSAMLQHAYALERLYHDFNPGDLAAAGASAQKLFRRLAQNHLSGLADQEGVIYARLSEVLPRRFWNNRGERHAVPEAGGPAGEARKLLNEALELDERLTALFHRTPASLDVAAEELSCGELLNRIRARVRRLEAST